MLTSFRLTLKLHRFEVGAAAIASVAIGIAAMVVVNHLNSTNVPPGCFEKWLTGGGAAGAGGCAAPVEAFGKINEEEAGKILAAMAILPFVIGLLAGVPLVGGELEGRTAQTAWFLYGSRLRWLVRQLTPVALVLAPLVLFAAVAADVLEQTRAPWSHSALQDLTLHGPIVLVRAFAALGIGLLFGALLGRTLPAFILGAALSVALVVGVGGLREQWIYDQRAVIGTWAAGDPAGWQGTTYGSVWGGSDGAQLDDSQAISLVPAGTTDVPEWLESHGYRLLPIGVSDDVAVTWLKYDAFAFGSVGAASVVAAAIVVYRRRPG